MSEPSFALLERRLVVCVGPGGVGKTSCAAALALRAAMSGKRAFVLTVDPARRLAQALGLALDDRASTVRVGDGVLGAAMLETRSSWDTFVERVASEPDVRRRILANRVYRAFSRTLVRSHAYVAMERLHALLEERDERGERVWDLVVLDTPPTRSALDVLDAPASLGRFVDERVVAALTGLGAGGVAAALLGRGASGALVQRALALVMGDAMARELIEFLLAFVPLREGFARRSRALSALFTSSDAAFVLVAAPRAAHLEDAAFLRDDLARRGVPLELALFNQAFAPGGASAEIPSDSLAQLRAAGATEDEARTVLSAARDLAERTVADEARATERIAEFLASSPPRVALALPRLPREPCSVAELNVMLDAARSVHAQR